MRLSAVLSGRKPHVTFSKILFAVSRLPVSKLSISELPFTPFHSFFGIPVTLTMNPA